MEAELKQDRGYGGFVLCRLCSEVCPCSSFVDGDILVGEVSGKRGWGGKENKQNMEGIHDCVRTGLDHEIRHHS